MKKIIRKAILTADPLSWTVKRENGKVYGMIDDREGHAFRFDPSTGMLLIFR